MAVKNQTPELKNAEACKKAYPEQKSKNHQNQKLSDLQRNHRRDYEVFQGLERSA